MLSSNTSNWRLAHQGAATAAAATTTKTAVIVATATLHDMQRCSRVTTYRGDLTSRLEQGPQPQVGAEPCI
jgi:hypothetical protein